MAPDGDKIRVTARISKELDTKVHRYYTNLAPAIIEGLELLVSMKEGDMTPAWHQSGTGGTGDLLALIGDKEKQIEFLKRQIDIKDSQLEKQAYSLQSLIQVNSALNMKILPEKIPIYTEEFQPAEEPEIISRAEQGASTASVKVTEIVLEEEPAQPMTEEPRPIPVQKKPKSVKTKPAKEIQCLNCGQKFSAQRATRKFCSGKCKAAYYRKA